MRPTRQLASLFEFPVLFYVLVILVLITAVQDVWLPRLCWCYVILRTGHAIVHIGFNRLWARTPVFIAGQFVEIENRESGGVIGDNETSFLAARSIAATIPGKRVLKHIHADDVRLRR